MVDNYKLPEPMVLTNPISTVQNIFATSQAVLSPPHSELTWPSDLDISPEPNNISDIEEFFNLRIKNPNNPLIGFLNINSLRNKIIDLRLVMERCLPDILVIEETKLNSDFKTESFLIHNYQITINN